MEHTNGTPSHTEVEGYTNGIDVHCGQNWVIRNNLFINLHTPDFAKYLWIPVILMRRGAGNALIENNIFVSYDRAIAYDWRTREQIPATPMVELFVTI